MDSRLRLRIIVAGAPQRLLDRCNHLRVLPQFAMDRPQTIRVVAQLIPQKRGEMDDLRFQFMLTVHRDCFPN